MTIREVINVLMDAPDKDEPFKIEIRNGVIPDDGYEWHTLEIENLRNCLWGSMATAMAPEDTLMKGGEENVW